VLYARDEANASVLEVLRTSGVQDAERAVSELAIPPVNVKHYIEVHIEQGPVLEAVDQPVGVVSAILGQTWLLVSAGVVGGRQGRRLRVQVLAGLCIGSVCGRCRAAVQWALHMLRACLGMQDQGLDGCRTMLLQCDTGS
jgi:hypothetical protein